MAIGDNIKKLLNRSTSNEDIKIYKYKNIEAIYLHETEIGYKEAIELRKRLINKGWKSYIIIERSNVSEYYFIKGEIDKQDFFSLFYDIVISGHGIVWDGDSSEYPGNFFTGLATILYNVLVEGMDESSTTYLICERVYYNDN